MRRAGVKGITKSRKILVVWTDRAAGIFFPRSAFATPGDEAEFVAFVEARIAENMGKAG
ncbi:MAG: hypothetical protein JSS20_01790 [Proteobacteria bacterium]|nr:hypothetical protein [Pseudomonadota bacterium]